jgi:hypothetical protein
LSVLSFHLLSLFISFGGLEKRAWDRGAIPFFRNGRLKLLWNMVQVEYLLITFAVGGWLMLATFLSVASPIHAGDSWDCWQTMQGIDINDGVSQCHMCHISLKDTDKIWNHPPWLAETAAFRGLGSGQSLRLFGSASPPMPVSSHTRGFRRGIGHSIDTNDNSYG